MEKTLKLSPAQWHALFNLAKGRAPGYGLVGMSEMGGLVGTMASLYRRGLVDQDHRLTDAGRIAVEERKSRAR